MKMYCVLMGGSLVELYEQKDFINLPKTDILVSFFSDSLIKKFNIIEKISDNILVDSGAFSFQNNQTKNNSINNYVQRYAKWIRKNDSEKITGFFEMDIDIIVGYEKVLEYRSLLEETTNKIIPVWHKDLGISEFKKMAQEYDYISVSCVKDKDIPPKQLPHFVKYAHKNNAKIHGLGMTREKILNTVPFDSVDSSSWFKASRFGRLYDKKLNSDYIKTNRYDIVFIEYLEFIKLHDYYYNKWKFYHND